jgi:hypothetical protein
MASGTGTYFAAKLLNQLFNATSYTYLTSLDLALFTTGGLTAGGAGIEVTGTGYARLPFTCNPATFPLTSTNTIANAVTLSFPAAGGPWTAAVTLGIYEHANNNLIVFGDLANSKTLSAGDVFQFTSGNLTITQS